jgi:hypothetical protein
MRVPGSVCCRLFLSDKTADTGRYFNRIASEPLPSPLRGRVWVGVRTAFFPPSQPSPAEGEGVLTYPYQPQGDGVRTGVLYRLIVVLTPITPGWRR